MFTKIESINFGLSRRTGLYDLAIKYSYPEDIDVFDIAFRLQDSKYPVDHIYVGMEDDQAYGGGTYTFERFIEEYGDLYYVSAVSFLISSLDASVVVFPRDRSLYLNYTSATKDLQLSDLLGDEDLA